MKQRLKISYSTRARFQHTFTQDLFYFAIFKEEKGNKIHFPRYIQCFRFGFYIDLKKTAHIGLSNNCELSDISSIFGIRCSNMLVEFFVDDVVYSSRTLFCLLCVCCCCLYSIHCSDFVAFSVSKCEKRIISSSILAISKQQQQHQMIAFTGHLFRITLLS